MELFSEDYLYHHGIKGQKWGKRQYQYEDGSLTPEGRERYSGRPTTQSVGSAKAVGNKPTNITVPSKSTPNKPTYIPGMPTSAAYKMAHPYAAKPTTSTKPKEEPAKTEVVTPKKPKVIQDTSTGKKGSGSKGKTGKSQEQKDAEKAQKEQERAEKKAAREAEKEKKKAAKEAEKKKGSIEETTVKTESVKEEKKDPIDEDETLSEREKKMYKGIRNILENTGQSMPTYYANKGFDSIFSQYFPGDIDPDEKAVIKKKFMKYYKLEHGDASIGDYYAMTYSDELKHYGVLGMKWGVRRYENYDGTLTQRGLKRYKKTKSNYEYSKKKYKTAKERYKAGQINKAQLRESRNEMREDKKTMKKYYKQLHDDKMADKGKERYARGERISTRGRIFGQIAEGASIVYAIARYSGRADIAKNAGIVSLGSAAAFGIINAYAELPMGSNAQLRAYYAHKSLPDVKSKDTSGSKEKTYSTKSSSSSSSEAKPSGTTQYQVSKKTMDAYGVSPKAVASMQKKLSEYKGGDDQKFVDSLTDEEYLALYVTLNLGKKQK